MNVLFYISALVAVVATALVILETHPIHALLNLIVSLLAVAVILFGLGAPFVAALEVIVYAGAIMVLFVFVIMMLNLGSAVGQEDRHWLRPRTWIAPGLLCSVLLAELLYVSFAPLGQVSAVTVTPHAVGIALFGRYLLAVELASVLLMAGLVGAYHVGRRDPQEPDTEDNC